jgi:hypothetical protein
VRGLTTFEELDRLTTKELRDRAFKVARHRLDIGFFWKLIEYAPVAEAIGGHTRHAQADVLSLSATVEDAFNSGEDAVEEALRPVYIEYLQEHQK